MNTFMLACIISAIYVVVNMGLHYKDSPTPNIKEGIVVVKKGAVIPDGFVI